MLRLYALDCTINQHYKSNDWEQYMMRWKMSLNDEMETNKRGENEIQKKGIQIIGSGSRINNSSFYCHQKIEKTKF